MPNLANAKKALRQNVVRRERNDAVRNEIDTLRRQVRKLIQAKKPEDALKLLAALDKKLDKAVTKNILKKNTAARLKSRTTASIKRSK